MTTLPQIWKIILTWLGINKDEPPQGQKDAADHTLEYNDKNGLNLTYIAANKVANMVVTDSQINVTAAAENMRTDLLNVCANKVWSRKKQIVSRAAGCGKVCIFPYCSDGKTIKYSIVPQSDIMVLKTNGEIAVDVAVLSDVKTVKSQKYGRFKRYTLTDGVHTITEFFANMKTGTILGETAPAATDWEALPPLCISNVKRLLFGEIDCPTDTRTNDIFYGVKITDGCDAIIKDIKHQMKYLANEYELKRAFVGADKMLFGADGELPNSQLFKIMDTGVDDFFEIFDPAIRADPIFMRLKASYEQLENQIGLSRGIYTSPENVGAYNNKSNIKRSIFDTYSFVTSFRDNVLSGLTDYLYACNVLAEYFGLTPQGVSFEDITVNISWSSAMIEDSGEEFSQMIEGVAQGAIDVAELRQWLTGESLDEAAEKVNEIKLRQTSPAPELEI